ncbi:hypothetical protein L873DRAFT_1793212 [Choiromyces venosus 120613-1]|uniref:Uncharacterized protein n=1 Tax=Choiromyces venosus 120613-1 TaxID=1336337 RepID=A0A3N4J709_9PEZI|nr:hypothetical protein L873DRAFT_1793212 [Choiromyces venosus 120613-1]
MVVELRKMEDEAIVEEFADDEEAMREMEALGGEPSLPAPKEQRDAGVGVGIGDLPPGAFAEEAIVDEQEAQDKDISKWKKTVRPITTKTQDELQEEDAPPNSADAELPSAGYDDEGLSNLESEDEHAGKKAMVETGKAVVKKVVRKIKATANANFRRLNIRGQGTKARGGGKLRKRR